MSASYTVVATTQTEGRTTDAGAQPRPKKWRCPSSLPPFVSDSGVEEFYRRQISFLNNKNDPNTPVVGCRTLQDDLLGVRTP